MQWSNNPNDNIQLIINMNLDLRTCVVSAQLNTKGFAAAGTWLSTNSLQDQIWRPGSEITHRRKPTSYKQEILH